MVKETITVLCTLRASLSGTFLQTLPDLVTPLKGHSLSPRSRHCLCDSAQARQLKQQLRSALVAGQWRGDTALTLPLFWRRSTVSPVFFGRYPRSSLHSLEASRCAGIIWLGFWQDPTGPLPVSHFQTRFRSSTDVPDNIVQNQPGSDLVLADCVRFWPNGSGPEASRCAKNHPARFWPMPPSRSGPDTNRIRHVYWVFTIFYLFIYLLFYFIFFSFCMWLCGVLFFWVSDRN